MGQTVKLKALDFHLCSIKQQRQTKTIRIACKIRAVYPGLGDTGKFYFQNSNLFNYPGSL